MNWVKLVDVRKVRREEVEVYMGRDGWGWKDEGWGNPWKIGRDGDREEVVRRFEVWFRERVEVDVELRMKVWGLVGKVLGCWCDGREEGCHVGVVSKWLDEVLG